MEWKEYQNCGENIIGILGTSKYHERNNKKKEKEKEKQIKFENHLSPYF